MPTVPEVSLHLADAVNRIHISPTMAVLMEAEKLKARGIKTVIVCGTTFQGVGLGTGSGAAQRGYKVVVPVDCMSSEGAYEEQYAAWHLYKGGPVGVVQNVTLTRSDLVTFAP